MRRAKQWAQSQFALMLIGAIAVTTAPTAARAEPPTEAGVRAARVAFNQAIARRDLARIRATLSPTYHAIAGRSSQTHGADAAVERWRSTFAADSLYECERTTENVTINAAWGLAHERGQWRCRYAGVPAGAPEGYATGTYDAKWQRDTREKWRLQAEVFTTIACVGASTACAVPDSITPAPNAPLARERARQLPARAVREARAWYNAAIDRGDAEGIAALFAPAYHAVFGRGPHIEGAAAALADWQREFRASGPGACVRTVVSVDANPAWGIAHERGSWRCRIGVDSSGTRDSETRTSGEYVAKWQRDVSNRWRVQVEVFTTLQCRAVSRGCAPPDPLAGR